MAYKYDIFISYRRQLFTRGWIDKHFQPLLEFWVEFELGRKPIIYTDDQLDNDIGTTWPIKLGQEISCSRILISLWTKNYLNSIWCTCEISHMLEREIVTGCRTGQNANGLIIPVIIQDGETLPINLSIIQNLDIKDYFKARMREDSREAEELENKIKAISGSIANCINNVPQWQNDWQINAINQFYQLYYKGSNPEQTNLPKFTS